MFSKILVSTAFLFSFSAFANHDGHGKAPECDAVRAACEKAGFTMGGHKEGKGLIVDCMGKIAKGETVAGVAVDPADPTSKACIDHLNMKKAEMKEKHKARKGK